MEENPGTPTGHYNLPVDLSGDVCRTRGSTRFQQRFCSYSAVHHCSKKILSYMPVWPILFYFFFRLGKVSNGVAYHVRTVTMGLFPVCVSFSLSEKCKLTAVAALPSGGMLSRGCPFRKGGRSNLNTSHALSASIASSTLVLPNRRK